MIDLPFIPEHCVYNAHMFYISAKNLQERTRLIAYLKENGIGAVFHYIPLHSALAGIKYGRFRREDKFTTQESERLFRLSIYYGLTKSNVATVCESIKIFITLGNIMQNNNSNIYGTRINLRPITLEDTALIVKWRNSPDVQKYFIFRGEITAETHTKYFNENIVTGKIRQFIIVDKDTSTLIGCVYLRDIDLQNDNAEFGIFIGDERFRKKGFGKEAAQLICKYAFEKLNLHSVSSITPKTHE